MNPLDKEPVCVLTMTVTAPAAWAGVVPVIEVALTRTTPVRSDPPKVMLDDVSVNPVPVMVTAVEPTAGPEFGETDVTNGAELNV